MKQKKLSRKELLWGLSHQQERVFFPSMCYWLEQWVTDASLPPFDAYSLNDWQQDAELTAAVPVNKIEKYAPSALIEILKTKPGIVEDKVKLLLLFAPTDCILRGDFALAALFNLKKYWQDGYENPAQFRNYLMKEISRYSDAAKNYDSLAAQLDTCPELFDILDANRMDVALNCPEKTAVAMVEVMNRLLLQIPKITYDHERGILKTWVNGYYQWLLNLRSLVPAYFSEISKIIDDVVCFKDYRVDNMVNLTSLKAETFIRNQHLDWNKYLEYIISTACPYSYSWKMEILNVLWEKELGADTDENLMLALHTLTDNEKRPSYTGCQAFLKKYLKRYPEKSEDVAHAADMLIKAGFARMNFYSAAAISGEAFTATYWDELPINLQKMWFWLLELELLHPSFAYHLSLLEWWRQNDDQEEMFRKLVKKSQKSSWTIDSETLQMNFHRIDWLLADLYEPVYSEVGRLLKRVLKEVVIDDKLWKKIAKIAGYRNLDLKQAFDAQLRLRARIAKQEKKLKAQAQKEEAEIEAFLKKLV